MTVISLDPSRQEALERYMNEPPRVAPKKTCGNCRFAGRVPTPDTRPEMIECRINPPTSDVTSFENFGRWPAVRDDDWCSKHSREPTK